MKQSAAVSDYEAEGAIFLQQLRLFVADRIGSRKVLWGQVLALARALTARATPSSRYLLDKRQWGFEHVIDPSQAEATRTGELRRETV